MARLMGKNYLKGRVGAGVETEPKPAMDKKRRGPKVYRGKKQGTSITLLQEHFDMVEALGVGNGLSAKLRYIIEEFAWRREQLVKYQDSSQKMDGTPAQIVRDAVRIYSCSAFQNGWSIEGPYKLEIEDVLDAVTAEGGREDKPDWLERVFLPELRKREFIVQIVNEIEYDLYDIWVSKRGWTRNENCVRCPRIERMKAAIYDPIEDQPAFGRPSGARERYKTKGLMEPRRTLDDVATGHPGDGMGEEGGVDLARAQRIDVQSGFSLRSERIEAGESDELTGLEGPEYDQ